MNDTGWYPSLRFDATGDQVVSHAGSVVLVETARRSGLDKALMAGLSRRRKPLVVHDPLRI